LQRVPPFDEQVDGTFAFFDKVVALR